MTFAFLFGLSMDYEVFMLSRIRKAYDDTGSTSKAIELGLARAGKLVTGGALILDVRVPGALYEPRLRDQAPRDRPRARVIFDATVIRALLEPALMRLLGDANWWMPEWPRSLPRIPGRKAAPETVTEST